MNQLNSIILEGTIITDPDGERFLHKIRQALADGGM